MAGGEFSTDSLRGFTVSPKGCLPGQDRFTRRSQELDESLIHVQEAGAIGPLDSQLVGEVAERTAAQDALRSSEERFSKAFHGSPVAMANRAHSCELEMAQDIDPSKSRTGIHKSPEGELRGTECVGRFAGPLEPVVGEDREDAERDRD